MKQILFTLALLSFFYSFAQTQGETSNWYFGRNAGINFNNNVVNPLINGQLFTGEGCSSISTKEGQLLFYTDGVIVYNGNHLVMPNGTGLFGSISSTQSAIIVPAPGNINKYYIFTCDAGYPTNTGVHYSVVDMTLDSGLGGITTKNVSLFTNSSEKLAAIKHQDGINYWVVAKTSFNTCYYSYLINCDGVQDLNPVVSCVGTKEVDSWALPGGAIFSPDGTKLVGCAQDTLEIMSFNTATGSLTNPILLPLPTGYKVYSAAFSPNNQLLYMNSRVSGEVYQMDISSNNSTTILNSIQLVGLTNGGLLGGYKGGALQLGPDNKIYAAQNESTYLAIINNPNTSGTSCNFQADAISLNGRLCTQGLPPFISSFFFPPDTIVSHNVCTGVFSLSIDNNYIDSLVWDFGDPASGNANRAVGTTTNHEFSAPATYFITAHRYIQCVVDIFYDTITIYPNPIANFSVQNVCKGNVSTFIDNSTTSNGTISTWNWDFGDAAVSNSSNPTHTYATNGDFDVHLQIINNRGCVDDTTITTTIFALPVASFSNNTPCFGNATNFVNLSLNPMGTNLSSWNFGDGSTSAITSPTHTYSSLGNNDVTLQLTTSEGCTHDTSIVVIVRPNPVANFSNTTPCFGNTTDFLDLSTAGTGTNLSSWSWDFGDGNTSVAPSPTYLFANAGNHNVTLTVSNNYACTDAITIPILVYSKATAAFNLDNTQLTEYNATIQTTNLSQNASTYFWDFGDNSFNAITNPSHSYANVGEYCILLLANNANNCPDTVSHCVQVFPESSMWIPNAFTPNEDIDNDFFMPQGINIVQFNMKIFDRWGELVFESDDIHKGWDGNYKKQPAILDIYTYKIEATDILGKPMFFVGKVALIQ